MRFGNNGIYHKPHVVQKVVFPDGTVVGFAGKEKRVMHDYTAYMVTDMLRSVVNDGTGKTANVPGLDVAGKTGTTNFDSNTRAKYGYPSSATNDSWFAGYTPQYTMAVWTGYAQNGQGNYMSGSSTKISQLMFRTMMQTFGTDATSFKQPSSVYSVNNELYIKGVGSAELPQKPKKEEKSAHENEGNKDERETTKEDLKHQKEEWKKQQEELKHQQKGELKKQREKDKHNH